MIKTILKNQKGISLVEVTVASALSVMVAVGVMRINENSNKAIRSLEQRSSLMTFETTLKNRLRSSDYCKKLTFSGGTSIEGHDIGAGIANLGAFSTGNGGGNEFIVGQPLTSVNGWMVKSAAMTAFNNNSTGSTVGNCDIEINLERIDIDVNETVLANKKSKSYGRSTKKIKIPMTCHVADLTDYKVTKCSSIVDVDEISGHWDVGTSANGDFLEFSGISGDPMVRIGGNQISDADVVAGFTLDPLSGQTTASGNLHGMQVPSTVAITFGNANQVELSYDPSNDDTDSGAGSTVNIDSSMRFTGSLILDPDSHPGGTNIVIPNRVYARGFMAVSGNTLAIGDSNDNVTIGDDLIVQGTFSNPSDEKIKTNIKTIESASKSLNKLRGVTYEIRDEYKDFGDYGKKNFGVIAQEVELIFPEFVSYKEHLNLKTVNYIGFIGVLIQANNEQQAELDKNKEMFMIMQTGIEKKNREQDQEIAELKDKNRLLEKRIDKLESALHERIDEIENKSEKIDELESKIENILELIKSSKED